MDTTSFITMLLLGFAASGHCIGMCGPLVIAIPGKTGKFIPHLCYHAGRTATYTIVGFLMGALGLIIAKFASLAGFDYLAIISCIQIFFSFLAGLFLLFFAFIQLGMIREPERLYLVTPEKIPGYNSLIHSAFEANDLLRMGLVGMLMGFLPCGLSFAAFSRALAASQPFEGGIFLFAFGVGTIPGLLLIGTGASIFARRYRKYFDIISGILMIWMASKLLMKGINAIIG